MGLFDDFKEVVGVAGDVVGLAGDVSSLFGGDGGARDRQFLNEQQLQLQRDLARHGVRWRVEDAKAAGIHPLAALGMQPAQASGIYLEGGSTPDRGELLSKFGQNISRAVDATRTQGERDDARISALRIEHAELQNDLLRSQIARLQADQVGPPMADPANPGVGVFGTSDARIEEKPLSRMAAAPGSPHLEAGSVTDLGFSRTPTGYAIVPSKDFKDRGEDQLIPEVAWAVRNHLLPTVSPKRFGYPPPETWLPEGASHWRFDRLKQEWQPAFTARGQARVRYRID